MYFFSHKFQNSSNNQAFRAIFWEFLKIFINPENAFSLFEDPQIARIFLLGQAFHICSYFSLFLSTWFWATLIFWDDFRRFFKAPTKFSRLFLRRKRTKKPRRGLGSGSQTTPFLFMGVGVGSTHPPPGPLPRSPCPSPPPVLYVSIQMRAAVQGNRRCRFKTTINLPTHANSDPQRRWPFYSTNMSFCSLPS